MTRATTVHSRLSRRLLHAVLLAAALHQLPLHAQQAAEPPAKEVSEKVSEEFGKLRPLIEAKNFPEALKVIDATLAGVKTESYDFVLLAQMKAQILLTMGELNKAAAPLEQSLGVAQKYDFLPATAYYDQFYLLSQIFYQQAAESKDAATQKAAFDKSYAYLQKAIPLAPKPTVDLQLFSASLLYNQASLSGSPDPEKFRQAIAEARKGLYLAVKPPENLYQFLLSSHQQLGELEPAAEILELMLLEKPQNAQNWQTLIATYMNLAGSAKDEAAAQMYNLRAIISIERAQSHGLLSSPAENYTLVALYFSIQQFARASELLEKGLKAGTIENQRKNWELLSSAYQQMKHEDRAIDALKRATTAFPKDGQLEFQMAQIYYTQGKVADAYTHSLKASDKGQLDKPGQTYLYLAYLGYELGKLDEASRWTEQASQQADVKPTDIAPIKRAITDALKEREELLAPSKA
jgi:Tfp pilus assembly protein PilF